MTHRPHDALFKAAFEAPAHAAGLLRGILPPSVHAALDWASITRESGSFIDPALRDCHSDLLFSVRLDGRLALLYLLLEHQSTVVEHMPLRVADYLMRIWSRHVKERGLPLPLLISATISHPTRPWSAPMTLHELVDPAPASLPALAPSVPNYAMLLLDLSTLDDAQLRSWALAAFPKLALLVLRDCRDPARLLAGFERWRDLFLAVQAAPGGAEAVAQILRYVALVTQDMHAEEFRDTISRQLPEAGEIAMTIAEELHQRGLQQGLQQGLLKAITLKFGPPSAELRARIEGASIAELERYLERILGAASLPELLGDG